MRTTFRARFDLDYADHVPLLNEFFSPRVFTIFVYDDRKDLAMVRCVTLVACLVLVSRSCLAVGPVFTDVTSAAGLGFFQPGFMAGGGIAAGDYDGDGWTDLYVSLLGGADRIYHNQGDGTFQLHALPQLLASNGAAWADVDNDGDLDAYVTSTGENGYHLLINDGTNQFTDEAVLRGADVPGPDVHLADSVSFGDFDRDGYVDIYVAESRHDFNNPTNASSNSRLLRNLGAANPGFFVDVTQSAGVQYDNVPATQAGTFAFSSRFSDMDGDGYPELIVTADFGSSRLFWNNRDGTFTDGTVAAGVGTDQFGMGTAIGDYDGDGLLDLFVTSIFIDGNPAADGNRLYKNNGDRTFTDVTTAAGVRDGSFGWGTEFFDYDNDRDNDLVLTNGFEAKSPQITQIFTDLFGVSLDTFSADQMKFFDNGGTGNFTEMATAVGLTDTPWGNGTTVFDYDNDGDLDVLVSNLLEAPVLYRNDGGNLNDYLRIDPVGTASNKDGLGAFITITPELGGSSQVFEISGGSHFLGQSESIAHFGLGDMSTDPDGLVDEVEIRWPSGIVQVLTDVNINQLLSVIEPILGDISQDGVVDIADFTLWGDAFGETGFWLPADLTNDDKVDIGDFTVWGDAFGTTSSVSSFGSAVPEPGGIVLMSVGLAGLLAAVWRRRHRRTG